MYNFSYFHILDPSIVGVVFDDAAYAFTNLTEVMDYYGENEDVALFRMKKTREADIHSLIRNQEVIDMPIDDIISDIIVMNERQRLCDKGLLTGGQDVFTARGDWVRGMPTGFLSRCGVACAREEYIISHRASAAAASLKGSLYRGERYYEVISLG